MPRNRCPCENQNQTQLLILSFPIIWQGKETAAVFDSVDTLLHMYRLARSMAYL
ncbi:hypothetical protein [Methanohalophilus sp.]|uniref:hypothetical protein n=1 Tax=Methanohalophilus sp. TaxID=1966352 RepID=UPI00260794A9|nr:hypothetical protein [Methanohalophilus sp.]